MAIRTLFDFTNMSTFQRKARVGMVEGFLINAYHVKILAMVFAVTRNASFSFGVGGGVQAFIRSDLIRQRFVTS
jgi:hypothetical protein